MRRRSTGLNLDPATSERLGRVRQQDTDLEIEVRRILRAMGASYRVRNRDLPGSPDVANKRARWAVYVHGCFWHFHRRCRRASIPKRNSDFWRSKLEANRARDSFSLREMKSRGYRVVTVWGCQLSNRPARVRSRLRDMLAQPRTRGKRVS